MKFNGWMRLWVVLSACWLFFVGHLAYADFSALFEQKKFEVAKEGLGKTTLVFSGSQTDIEIQAHISEKIVPLIEKEPRAYLGKVVTDPYDSHVQKRLTVTIVQYVKIALDLAPGIRIPWLGSCTGLPGLMGLPVFFELHRADVGQRRVQSGSVVPEYPGDDFVHGLAPGLEALPVQPLHLQ